MCGLPVPRWYGSNVHRPIRSRRVIGHKKKSGIVDIMLMKLVHGGKNTYEIGMLRRYTFEMLIESYETKYT